jgi:DNA-directed RNA polymerase specialized sigma24 family protein
MTVEAPDGLVEQLCDGEANAAKSPRAAQPQPSQIVQAGKLWDRMLALCSPDHRKLLLLKRQGLSLVDIALRTGLHEGSVRRIFRRLARRLALDEPAPGTMDRLPASRSRQRQAATPSGEPTADGATLKDTV